MKDPMLVLRMKELELLKVRKEIDALHIVARLLSEERTIEPQSARKAEAGTAPKMAQNSEPKAETKVESKPEAKAPESKGIAAKPIEADMMEPIIMEPQPVFRQLIEMP